MNELLLIAGMAAVTFLIRYPMLALIGRVNLPKPVVDALGYVPPAVLAAIVAPALLMPNGTTIVFGLTNRGLLAGVVAGLTMWRSKNLILTIVLGMAVYLLLPLALHALSLR
jgi:branched-subunit amino acid transport protein